MIPLSGSRRKTLMLALILGCMVLVRPNLSALAQETPPQYTVEEYSAYQVIAGESDPAKKTELIVKFFNDRQILGWNNA